MRNLPFTFSHLIFNCSMTYIIYRMVSEWWTLTPLGNNLWNSICKYLLHSVALLILLMVSFTVQKFFCLMKPLYLFFLFVSLAWGDIAIKLSLSPVSKSILLVFSSQSLLVPGLIFKSFIYFVFIFVYGVESYTFTSNLIILSKN